VSQTRPSILRRRDLAAGVVIVLLLAAVFGQVVGFGFVYDDDVYVSANPRVQEGLTPDGVRWAFTTTHAEFWHPLLWLSLMLDRQLLGPSPAGFHLTNLLLHLANALLLALVVRRLTGSGGAGLLAALLFSLHPLRAESVGWVSDRKDLLAAFFCLLTVRAYHAAVARRGTASGVSVPVLFALAVMAKPTVVTLPLALLALDWWPLNRFPAGAPLAARLARLRALVAEKVPLLLLSGAGAVVGYLAPTARGGTADLAARYRIANALISAIRYPLDTLWPAGLAAYYPHRWDKTSLVAAGGAAVALLAVTALLVRLRRSPHLLAGWLWYLATILPVLGLLQAGSHARADRYTYLPHLGFALACGAAASQSLRRRPGSGRLLLPAMAALVAVLSLLSYRQTAFWRDGVTLYRRALAVTTGNTFAHMNLGTLLLDQREFPAAAEQFQSILRTNPRSPGAHWHLALALHGLGQEEEALRYAREAVRLRPGSSEAHHNLGFLLAANGRVEEAIAEWRETIALNPSAPEPYVNLGIALGELGRTAEAVAALEQALAIDPRSERARTVLARLRPVAR
jgi:tetratricopeptide (TPR) repeat protein